jgi:NADH-quinone oxidoreductase subunit A
VVEFIAAFQQPAGSAGDAILLSYIPILMIFGVAMVVALGMITVSFLFGQRKPTKEKLMPYECGKDPVGSARERHSVRFYLVAMIFLLFDIEAIFLIPWAVSYGNVLAGTDSAMKLLFYGEMMAFIAVLFVGLIYVWKKGIFEWNR